MSKLMWNERYSTDSYVYGIEPNRFFKEELARLGPGKVLLPADGEGRNGVHAAEAGWDVSAFDQSEEGRKKALQLASLRGVSLDYRIMDLAGAVYPPNYFNAIALIFVHIPKEIRRTVHRKLVTMLKPGGTLIFEGFSSDQLKYGSGGPKDPDMLFTEERIREDFKELKIKLIERKIITVEEGEGHRGLVSVVRMVAVRI